MRLCGFVIRNVGEGRQAREARERVGQMGSEKVGEGGEGCREGEREWPVRGSGEGERESPMEWKLLAPCKNGEVRPACSCADTEMELRRNSPQSRMRVRV